VTTTDGAAGALVVAVVAVLPPVAAGHASTGASHQVVVSALLLHVAAALAWTGGLVALLLTVRLPIAEKAAAAGRFSALAVCCFAVTALSGVVGAAARVERWSDLTATTYGAVLVAKSAVLVALGVLGWWHRRRSLPDLDAGRSWVFARIAGVEVLVMAAAMGLAVALSRTPPPNDYGALIFETPLTPALQRIPDPVLLCVALWSVAWYVTGVRRLRGGGPPWPGVRTAAWIGGWTVLLGTATVQLSTLVRWPSSTVVAVQLLIAATVVPALLVAGAPAGLARRIAVRGTGSAMWRRAVAGLDRPVARVARRPGAGVGGYAIACAGIASTIAYDWSDQAHLAHLAVVGSVVTTGALLLSAARAVRTRPAVYATGAGLQVALVLGLTGHLGDIVTVTLVLFAVAAVGATTVTTIGTAPADPPTVIRPRRPGTEPRRQHIGEGVR
jgi:putative copper resistance protein D